MNSRSDILKAIRQNKPAPIALPAMPGFPPATGDLVTLFKDILEEISAQVVEVDEVQAIASALATRYPDCEHVGSASVYVADALSLEEVDDPHTLAMLDLFVCEGSLGVVENGAIWVCESQMVHRAAPFLTQHLALVLDKRALVGTMHDAYERIQIDEEGFGVFIAGPSKTADIEQSLVIGAHGPRSLTVVLY